ncbi:hypothetical protein, partial [Thiolapillus sp.]|uniref:hypothetical protein n=1 Tax=Thiolapillus sp. TaxID=2017437 RepID=UPI003AF44A33
KHPAGRTGGTQVHAHAGSTGTDVGGAEIARDASIQVAGWRRVMGKAGSGIAEQVATVATVVFVL